MTQIWKNNDKYMGKKYDENIESSYFMYLDANNLNRWAMSQKLPVDGFKQVKDLSKINESFIKNYNEIMIKHIFLKQMLNIQKIIQSSQRFTIFA